MNRIILPFLLLIQVQLSGQAINLEYIHKNAINLHAVSDGNENFEGFEKLDSLLSGVEIVMLGEQTHQDGTTFETKIKLIKYLHQQLGFDVLAFESSMYECEKAWDDILAGGDLRMNLGKAINTFWSPLNEFKYLTDYIETTLATDHPLVIKGFDNQLGGAIAEKTLIIELKEYLKQTAPTLINEELLEVLNNKLIKNLWYLEFKEFKKQDAKAIVQYLEEVIAALHKNKEGDEESDYWLKQLHNLRSFVSDLKLGTAFRDEEMAKNLIWLKEKNPDQKIICWGATSHFLYKANGIELLKPIKSVEQHYRDTRMMGDYIKAQYEDKVYTVGFTAYDGAYGTIGYGAKRKVDPALQNSLEFLLHQAEYENYLLPLGQHLKSSLPSRPLGYVYIKNNIATLMDAIIFNQTMKRPKADLELFKQLYPEHKHIK